MKLLKNFYKNLLKHHEYLHGKILELEYNKSKNKLSKFGILDRKKVIMKKGIHPDYKKTVIKCVCGNEIETASVAENITVEICNNCHPFYTGQQKILDSEGRVERFKKRYGQK